jgi:hypothetical protein
MPNNNPDASESTGSSSNNHPSANQSVIPPSNEAAPPYTLTEQDGRINVAFTSGPMQVWDSMGSRTGTFDRH